MKKVFFLLLTIFLSHSFVYACSDFVVKAKDGSVVNGRSMEFPVDMKANIWVVPRGESFTSVTDKKVVGVSWTNRYGFLAFDAFKVKDGYVDGLNEKGLSFSGLAFGTVQYQPAVPGKFVTWRDFGAWLLGNFASVAEVKKALPAINVADSYVKEIKGNMGLHAAIHDATGQSIVVEFVDGKMNVYDNPLGVMTNRPELPWQLNNLRNYVNLEPTDKKPRKLNGVEIEPTGVGSGLLGLPGDWTPPSRFVRLAFGVDGILQPKNASEALNAAEHLLNIVDIPKGMIKEHPSPILPFVTIYGYAQWVTIKDMTNRALYYKTYENTEWKKIDLSKFALEPGNPRRSIVVASGPTVFSDVSGALK